MNLPQSFLGAARLLAGAICLTFFGGTTTSLAAGLFEPATPAHMAAVANRRISRDAVTVGQRFVVINQAELARHIAPVGMDQSPQRVERAQSLDGNITLELFPNAIVNLRRTQLTANPDGGYVWEGADPNRAFFEALLIIENGGINGRVQLKDRIFRISHLGGRLHLVTELDPSRFLPEAPPQRSRSEPSPIDQIERNRNEFRLPSVTDEPRAAAAPAGVRVRVLVVYTGAAAAAATASGSSIGREINRAINLANQAYRRGNIPIVLELAAKKRVAYAETGDMRADLRALRTEPAFRSVRRKRGEENADLVSMIVANARVCGLARQPDVNPDSGMPSPSQQSRTQDAYSVVLLECIDGLSFHHELAHNMGLNHDRAEYGPAGDAVYHYGYVNLPSRIRTVMAYDASCLAAGFNCPRVNYFSSPMVKAQPGDVTIGVAQDEAGAADNTRRLKETAVLAASYMPWPVTASAESLEPLPGDNAGQAAGVSADGSVVVGVSQPSTNEERAFRRTKAGISDLGVLPGHIASQAAGVSANGSVVVGVSRPSSGGERAFRWTKAGIVNLGVLPGLFRSIATGVSADGSVVVGYSTPQSAGGRAFRWTKTGMVDLGVLPGHIASIATGVSADGSVVVGVSASSGGERAFRWTKAGMVDLGVPPDHIGSYAIGVSADGAVVVGRSFPSSGSSYEAFRWTKAGMVSLGVLPGHAASIASGVSADGAVVVGASSHSSAADPTFRWTATTGMKSINALLAESGISFTTVAVRSVSADGSTFVGRDNTGKAFIVTLPPPPPGP